MVNEDTEQDFAGILTAKSSKKPVQTCFSKYKKLQVTHLDWRCYHVTRTGFLTGDAALKVS